MIGKAALLGGLALATSVLAAPQFVPTGAKIETSGYATIEKASPKPYPDAPPPAENRPGNEAEWYARENGISVSEAAKRKAEQQAMFPAFERLITTLRNKEPGNFTAARMIHKPDWGYELYFKRDPERTLAKYTADPRFTAKLAGYTREELEALIKPWTERFAAHNLTGGWGTDDTHGTAEIMMAVTEEEYREIAAREGWGPLPKPITLQFAAPLPFGIVDERVKPLLRAFGNSRRSTVVQLLAAGSGRITLRNGCLYVGDSLAYFHRETGIGLDEEGYLSLIDRRTGKPTGRIGEEFTWGGPNSIAPGDPAAAELKARCGNAPIANVGNPESSRAFRVRPWEVDEVARRRRISRERAWTLLKACWQKQDAARDAKRPQPACTP